MWTAWMTLDELPRSLRLFYCWCSAHRANARWDRYQEDHNSLL